MALGAFVGRCDGGCPYGQGQESGLEFLGKGVHMATVTFDTLDYFEKLKRAGFTEAQAKVQVEAMQGVVRQYDEASRKDIATKGDIQDVRLEIEKVRAELKTDMEKVKYDLLKWQIGGWVALAAIMAKGFGWLGF